MKNWLARRAEVLAVAGAGVCAWGGWGERAALGQYLMITDSTADKVGLYSAADGSVVNADFIVNGAPVNFQTPKEATQIGSEIWVADQVSDAVFCFTASLTPTYIRTISGGMDNIRGLGRVGNRVYVSNNGTANGAPGRSVVVFELNGTPAGSFPVSGSQDPFDCTEFNGQILVPNFAGHSIYSYTTAGALDHVFHDSTATGNIRAPEQVIVLNTGAGGAQEVWVAGFTTPSGVYRYDASGNQVAYYGTVTGLRGVNMLGSGDLIVSNGSGVRTFTPGAATSTVIATGTGYQYISPLTLAPSAVVCCRGATCAVVAAGSCTAGSALAGATVGAGAACNAAMNNTTPCCHADYNKAGGVGVQDIFDFLADWFAGSVYAIPGGNGATGTLSVSNIFDFLALWFAGGC